MDPDIEQLKEMVARNLELTQETNAMVHKLRRGARWSTFFNAIYWLFILGALGASYFYVSPFVAAFAQFYRNIETNPGASSQSQTQAQQFIQSFKNLLPHSQ